MLENLSDAQIRDHCRARIESLELWLRRLIDGTLSDAYGGNYFDQTDASGNRIVKKQIVDSLEQRLVRNPGRYPRKIDALLLDDAIALVCHPTLFFGHFKNSVGSAFPGGAEGLREMLRRLVDVRNRLSHANPISLSDALRVSCYSGDIIESVRAHYLRNGMNSDYNVPLILRVVDCFGGSYHREQFSAVHDGGITKMFQDDPSRYLRPGDILTVEVEVDSAFDESGYSIRWASTRPLDGLDLSSRKVVVPITNSHIGAQFSLHCNITSNKDWHRMSMGVDDFLMLIYKVLPPL